MKGQCVQCLYKIAKYLEFIFAQVFIKRFVIYILLIDWMCPAIAETIDLLYESL